MKHFLSTVGVVVILSAASVSCDKINPPQPELQKPPATSGRAGQQEEGERKAFAQAAQKELDELREVIAGFRPKAEAANLQIKARLAAEVEELEADLREAQQRLTELRSATVESWKQVKDAFGKALLKLNNRIDSFRKNAV